MKTYVLYHANCQDGLGAKYAAWKRFGDDAEYIAVQYGKPLPELSGKTTFEDINLGESFLYPSAQRRFFKQSECTAEIIGEPISGINPVFAFGPSHEVEGDVEVFVVDFSYPLEVLEDLRSRVKTLVVLDHHKTAEEALRGFPGAHFDMTKSGAVLTWEYFHPDVKVPMLLQHIQDRDLWQFKLQGTRELHTSMLIIGDDMVAWDAIAEDSEAGQYCLTEAVRSGNSILRYQQSQVDSFIKHVKVLPYKGYKAGVSNTTTLISETGSAVCNSQELGVDFSMSYFFDTDGQPIVSFRSLQDGVDVSELAKELNGGGHHSASGAKVSIEFLSQLYAGQL